MYSNNLFEKFCRHRNIKSSTKKCYDSILRLYEKFQGESIENLFDEVYNQENETIPFKYRKIKK